MEAHQHSATPEKIIHRSGGTDLHITSLVMLAAGIGVLVLALLNPNANIVKAEGGWVVRIAFSVLLLGGLAVSCMTRATIIDVARKTVTRTRHWFFGLFRTAREYQSAAFTFVALEVSRVVTQSSGEWSIFNVTLNGPRLRIVVGCVRSVGTASGGPVGAANGPNSARDQAHVLALRIARPLALPIDFIPWMAMRNATGQESLGEFSAFPASELANMSREQMVGCIRQLLAARDTAGQPPREFDTLKKQEDSAVLIYQALFQRGGPELARKMLEGSEFAGRPATLWLASVWGLDTVADHALQDLENFGPPPRKQKEEPEAGGFDWAKMDK